MKTILAFTLAVFTVAHAFAAPKVGAPAPEFSATDTNGKTHSLADFKGKHVVLEWVNHGCPFVVKHYESDNMQKLQKDYTSKGVVWLSVSTGQKGEMSNEKWNEATKKKNASPTAVLLDGDGKIGKAYEAKTTPHMFVIDPKGTLVYAGAIDDKPTADKADVAGANNYIRAALNESMDGKPVSTASSKPYGCGVKY